MNICKSQFILGKYYTNNEYLKQFINDCIYHHTLDKKLKYDLHIHLDMDSNISTHNMVSIVQLIQILHETINKYMRNEIIQSNIKMSYHNWCERNETITQCEIYKQKPLRFAPR